MPPLLLTQAGALVHDMEFGPDRPGPSIICANRWVSRPRIRLDLTGMTHLDHACRDQVEEFTARRGAELLMPGSGNASTADMAGAGAAPEPFVREEPRTATLPRRPASLAPAEDRAHAEAPSTPMPGPTAEWFYLDTQPFTNDYATP